MKPLVFLSVVSFFLGCQVLAKNTLPGESVWQKVLTQKPGPGTLLEATCALIFSGEGSPLNGDEPEKQESIEELAQYKEEKSSGKFQLQRGYRNFSAGSHRYVTLITITGNNEGDGSVRVGSIKTSYCWYEYDYNQMECYE